MISLCLQVSCHGCHSAPPCFDILPTLLLFPAILEFCLEKQQPTKHHDYLKSQKNPYFSEKVSTAR